jgi:hypothetical protein
VPCRLHHQAPHLGHLAKILPLFSVAVHAEAAQMMIAISCSLSPKCSRLGHCRLTAVVVRAHALHVELDI